MRVDADAVLDREAGRVGERVSGSMPMPTRTRSAASLVAVGELGAGDAAAGAGQPDKRRALADVDAVAAVEGAEVVGGGGGGDAGEDARRLPRSA